MTRKTVKRLSAPLFPEHPEIEHRRRVDRARKLMKEDNLNALVLARNVNVFYMTGSRFVFVGWDYPSTLAPQSTAIITPEADIYCQRFGAFDRDEVAIHTTWSESLELYNDELELVNILKDYDVGKGDRIGIEWGQGLCTGMNPIKFLALKKQVSKELGAEFADATTTIWKMTSIKSELEIERMKTAVTVAARAMERLYDVIKLGLNELEVARMASRFMIEEGADSVTHAQVMAEGDEGLRLLSNDALDRTIGKGWLHLDLGCKYKRYGSDINRGVFLGREPKPDEIRLYQCRQGVNEFLDRKIKPGECFDNVIIELKEYVEGCGCILKDIGGNTFIGHGIGLEPYQHPNLVPSAAQPEFQNKEGKVLFEPGMMFTYEMAVELPDSPNMPFFNIEDDVVVTETGVENMNSMLSRDLNIMT